MRRSPPCELTGARVAGGILLLAAVLPPSWVLSGPPLCPFRLLTGLPCPGCGLTRSVVSFLHGDVAGAIAFHPLGPLVVAALALAVLVGPLSAQLHARGWAPGVRLGGPRELWISRAGQAAPWLAIGIFLTVWLVRLPLYLQGRWVY